MQLDLLSYRMLLVPVLVNSNHWILAVADVHKRELLVYDSLGRCNGASLIEDWQ